jgi:hypothetical protein
MKYLVYLAAFVLAAGLNSCATFINSTTQEIEIKSTPENASITIDGKKFGLTPQIVNIDRGRNHVLKIELDGYEPYETQLTRKISFWFWGNALNGFIPGMTIDMFTGSMYNLFPGNISVELQKAKEDDSDRRRR